MSPINPLISVIIPTYNHGQFIGEAIDSVLAQTYKNLEVIVVDDGSTDNTKQVLEKYGKEITYIYRDNRGVSSARNHGISLANGTLIAFLDSDDVWLPEKLELQLKTIQEEDSVGLVGCGGYIVDYFGKIEREWLGRNVKSHDEFLKQLLIMNIFRNPSCALVKRECFDRVGLFKEKLKFGEDWDMWIRIAKYYRVRFVEKPLMKFRINNVSKAYRNVKTIKSNIKTIIQENADHNQKVVKRKAQSRMYTDIALYCLDENEKLRSIYYIMKALCQYPFKTFPEDNKVKILLKSMLPNILNKKVRSVRRAN